MKVFNKMMRKYEKKRKHYIKAVNVATHFFGGITHSVTTSRHVAQDTWHKTRGHSWPGGGGGLRSIGNS